MVRVRVSVRVRDRDMGEGAVLGRGGVKVELQKTGND